MTKRGIFGWILLLRRRSVALVRWFLLRIDNVLFYLVWLINLQIFFSNMSSVIDSLFGCHQNYDLQKDTCIKIRTEILKSREKLPFI